MRSAAALVVLGVLLANPVAAQSAAADGRIVADTACTLLSTRYATWLTTWQSARARELAVIDSTYHALPAPDSSDTKEWTGARQELITWRPMAQLQYDSVFGGRYDCRRLRYLSDGLRVVTYLFRPKLVPGVRHPVMIFNRGGSREFSKIEETFMARFRAFLARGYIIVAPQYRGNDGGEGQEEYGGADVRDVVHLLPLIRGLPDADTTNVFMYGASRGGLQTYVALRQGMAVNAAVVHAGPTDLAGMERFRPGFEREVFSQLIADFPAHRTQFYADRSALEWADEIRVPVLILHGTADWRVDPNDALRMAARLQALGREYGLVMYAGDDHFLSANRRDVDRRIMEWFEAHRR